MFRTVPLSIIKSFSLYTQQWYTSYSFDDSLRTVSKTVEFYSKNKFEKLVQLVGFLYEFITMHGHLNVKL